MKAYSPDIIQGFYILPISSGDKLNIGGILYANSKRKNEYKDNGKDICFISTGIFNNVLRNAFMVYTTVLKGGFK